MMVLDRRDPVACREYADFAAHHPRGQVMQSLPWVQVKSRWRSEVLLVRRDGRLVAGMQVLIRRWHPLLPTMLYAPRGPVCEWSDTGALRELLHGVRELAEREHAYLFCMDPPVEESDRETIRRLCALGLCWNCRPPEFSTIQPRHNYVLDIEGKSEEQVLAGFHRKWRYNIRLAQRRGVVCGVYGAERLDDFYAMLVETGRRDGFPIREKRYFARMLAALGEHVRLYICELEGVPVSGAIVTRYAGVTCYLYGASSSRHRESMPNYLMQWTMIRDAIRAGDRLYDFQGVPYYDRPDKPNYGVYRFKRGFGGQVVSYAGEFCLHFHPTAERMARRAMEGYQAWQRIVHRIPRS